MVSVYRYIGLLLQFCFTDRKDRLENGANGAKQSADSYRLSPTTAEALISPPPSLFQHHRRDAAAETGASNEAAILYD